jgi:hypothetical protein
MADSQVARSGHTGEIRDDQPQYPLAHSLQMRYLTTQQSNAQFQCAAGQQFDVRANIDNSISHPI